MAYTVSTAPASEPVTTAEAKLSLRVDHSEEDDLIDEYIQAAREYVEGFTNRGLMTQTIKQYYAAFPCALDLRFAPIQSVTSVKYYDGANVQQTLVLNTDYYQDIITEPGQITPVDSWPTTYTRPDAVEVEFIAGYANAASVPAKIKQVMYLLIGEMYEVRENSVKRLPTAAEYLLNTVKVFL